MNEIRLKKVELDMGRTKIEHGQKRTNEKDMKEYEYKNQENSRQITRQKINVEKLDAINSNSLYFLLSI